MDNRELNRKVAEALGWMPTLGDFLVHTSGAVINKHVVPWYSADIADAIRMIDEYASARGLTWEIKRMPAGNYCAQLFDERHRLVGRHCEDDTVSGAACHCVLWAEKSDHHAILSASGARE